VKRRKKTTCSPEKGKQDEELLCKSSCRERGKLCEQELSSLTTLVGALALLLAVITPSEGKETSSSF
jgi:hypothetical protein